MTYVEASRYLELRFPALTERLQALLTLSERYLSELSSITAAAAASLASAAASSNSAGASRVSSPGLAHPLQSGLASAAAGTSSVVGQPPSSPPPAARYQNATAAGMRAQSPPSRYMLDGPGSGTASPAASANPQLRSMSPTGPVRDSPERTRGTASPRVCVSFTALLHSAFAHRCACLGTFAAHPTAGPETHKLMHNRGPSFRLAPSLV
jgi:hypothetical protein